VATVRAAYALGALLLAACGARSDLGAPPHGLGGAASTVASSTPAASSSGSAPCVSDADCDDGISCTTDACTPTGCVHTPNDALCDDGKLCTIDTCVAGSGCQHTISNAPCDDGIACTTDTCDPTTNTCSHVPCDAMCESFTLCDGVQRCDAAVGCVSGPPPCQLGLACSTDSCDETGCAHAQADGCAPSLRLVLCDAGGNLISVSPYGAPSVTISPSNGSIWFDVAILKGRWFVTDGNGTLAELHPKTNKVKKSFMVPLVNSLGAGPEGFLYAANSVVFRLDPDTGASTMVGSLPPGYTSSGDVAFFGGKMYVSTDGPCGGALVEVDPATGAASVIGGDGLGCVYGLAATSSTMFVVNCDGSVGTFDPGTGEVQVLSTTGVQAYGADVLP